MTVKSKPIKHYMCMLLCVCTVVILTPNQVYAATFNISFSGEYFAIVDGNGDAGGAFSPGVGVNVGDSFFGAFTVNTDTATPNLVRSPFVTTYNIDFAKPKLTVNGSDRPLYPEILMSVGNDADLADSLFDSHPYIRSGAYASGVDSNAHSLDFLFLSADLVQSPVNGHVLESSLFMFDTDGTTWDSTDIPSQLVLMGPSFLSYIESNNGIPIAAALGQINSITITTVPLPAAGSLLVGGLLLLIRVGKNQEQSTVPSDI